MWVWFVLSSALCLGVLPQGECHIGVGAGGGLGESSKPPILSHVRVSRGPEDYNLGHSSDLESALEDDQVTRSIKSPSYQHKQMNRLSQFHGQGVHPYLSDVTYSLRPYSGAIYPVASVQAKGGGGGSPGPFIIPQLYEESVMQSDEGDNLETQSPTFTPYIGSRILSNIPKFFEHLHENIKAIHDSNESPSSDDTSGSSISVENPLFFSGEVQMDMPSRRGDYFQNLDGSLYVDSKGYRYSAPEGQMSRDHQGHGGDYASNDMLLFMGRDPKYKKANNYNPSWLFTNLGLGKRSGHRYQARNQRDFHHRSK